MDATVGNSGRALEQRKAVYAQVDIIVAISSVPRNVGQIE